MKVLPEEERRKKKENRRKKKEEETDRIQDLSRFSTKVKKMLLLHVFDNKFTTNWHTSSSIVTSKQLRYNEQLQRIRNDWTKAVEANNELIPIL